MVKWLGYPKSDNTWEPVENLHADDLIQDYKHRWQGAVQQVVTAIHLRAGKMEDKRSAFDYQMYTDGQLHQALNQSQELHDVKQIAQEAL